MKQLPNLTSIRFVLAILVVLFHIPQFFENRGLPFYNDIAIFNKGKEAVCMFFALSGFLIIKQLYDEKQLKNTIDIKVFFLKRVLRIMPLYYLILIFGLLYYRIILPYFGYDFESNYDLLTGLLLALTFFPNIFASYFPGGILEILWSIGIEEQFYIIIAPLFLILPFKRIFFFLVTFTVLYLLIYFSESFVFLKNYNMLFFYFSFSGLCAIILKRELVQNLILKIQIPTILVIIIYFSTSLFNNYLNEIAFQIFSMILFGLTISVLSQKRIKILDQKVTNYLGKISYGIYMFHAIVMQFVGITYLKIMQKLNLPDIVDIILINLLVIAGTIAISHFSFKYYEGYFLKLKSKLNKNLIAK